VGRARLDSAGKPLARKADRKRKKRAAGTAAAMPTETAPSDDAVEAASDSIGDAYESGGDSSSDADSGDSSGASSAAAKSPAAARFPFSPQPTQQ
jgi:hypothetical protein